MAWVRRDGHVPCSGSLDSSCEHEYFSADIDSGAAGRYGDKSAIFAPNAIAIRDTDSQSNGKSLLGT